MQNVELSSSSKIQGRQFSKDRCPELKMTGNTGVVNKTTTVNNYELSTYHKRQHNYEAYTNGDGKGDEVTLEVEWEVTGNLQDKPTRSAKHYGHWWLSNMYRSIGLL